MFRTYQIEETEIDGDRAEVRLQTQGLGEQVLLSALEETDTESFAKACTAETNKEQSQAGVILPSDLDSVNISCLYSRIESDVNSALTQKVQSAEFTTHNWLVYLKKGPDQEWQVVSMILQDTKDSDSESPD